MRTLNPLLIALWLFLAAWVASAVFVVAWIIHELRNDPGDVERRRVVARLLAEIDKS